MLIELARVFGYDKVKTLGDALLFGYIKANKPELRVREYEIYKAVYCSLCRELGHSFGPAARFTLSYDFTFLALLRMSLQDGCPSFQKKRCAFNPLVKCNCTKGEDLKFSSAAAMIILYYKILDNISDSRFFGRLKSRLVYPLFALARRRAKQKYPEIERLVAESIKRQSEVERGAFEGIDSACEPTAQLLANLFSLTETATETQKRVLERLGYCIGKWVYLADALDDLEDDTKSGGFNPILAAKNMTPNQVRELMNICIAEAGAALELLEVRRYYDILANVIYLGLPQVQKQIGQKEKKTR